MRHTDHEWVFVCEDCGEEWPTEEESKAREHERRCGHQVYHRHKATLEQSKFQEESGKGSDDETSRG